MERIMRRPEVEQVSGLRRSTLYAWIAAGQFPAPVRLGARLVGWRLSDVQKWIDARAPKEARE